MPMLRRGLVLPPLKHGRFKGHSCRWPLRGVCGWRLSVFYPSLASLGREVEQRGHFIHCRVPLLPWRCHNSPSHLKVALCSYHTSQHLPHVLPAPPPAPPPKCPPHCLRWSSSRKASSESAANALTVRVTVFDDKGVYETRQMRKSDVLLEHGIQKRDIRFSKFSSLYVRASSIILHLQHIKAIINHNSLVLLDSDHPAIEEFIPELQERLREREESLPFEFTAMEALLMKMFSVLDSRIQELEPALRDILNSLLDPRLFSVDRGELHILLHQSKSLSEFHSLVKDIEGTLTDMLDAEEDMADMYLTHLATTGVDREPEETEEANNILESYLMQAENMLSEVRQLQELVERSESIILINLDSQRNVMLRLGLQLEMGMFSATLSGLVGMAFGMNLENSIEENPYAFWMITGLMVTVCGLLWRRLLTFLGKNLEKTPFKRIIRSKRK